LALASPRGRRFMQIVMLAPDWTVATARSFYKAFPGMSEPQVAALHRQYLLRQAMIYLTLYNGVNVALSGHNIWQNEDPTMIDAGDGRRIQMAKHTMEPIHWLTSPSQQAWNKLGYPVKEPLLQAFGKDYITLKKPGDVGGPPIGNRIAHLFKGASPIPLTTLANQGPGTALSGMFGVPMYGRTEDQAAADAIERALTRKEERDASGSTTKTQTPAQAEKRTRKAYEKKRAEQAARNEKSLADRLLGR